MSTGQNGNGSRARNTGPRFKQNYDSIKRRREYRIVTDDDDAMYVIPTDECATFEHWLAAKKGQHRMPDFTPVPLMSVAKLRFENWREEK